MSDEASPATSTTRIDPDSAKDKATEAEVKSNVEAVEKKTPKPKKRAKPSPDSAFTKPLRAEGTSIRDGSGLTVCRVGLEHGTLKQREELAVWIADKLSA